MNEACLGFYAHIHTQINSIFDKKDDIISATLDLLIKLLDVCDPFWENVPKVAKTTIEIWLKVGNYSIFNKYLKLIFSPIIALPL